MSLYLWKTVVLKISDRYFLLTTFMFSPRHWTQINVYMLYYFYSIQREAVVCDKSGQVLEMERRADTSVSERISPKKDDLMYKIDDVPPW